jgi:hypothetical protein
VVVILAGGLFGAIWNTTDSVRSELPPAKVQPSPTVEPGWTVESFFNDTATTEIYTV